MRTIGNLQISGSLITSGSITATTFIGDGSGLTGVTSYTDTDTLDYINTLGVVSSSAQLSTEISGAFTSVSASIASDIWTTNAFAAGLDSKIYSLEQFSASLDTTFATDADVTSISGSLASDITNNSLRLSTLEAKPLVSSSTQITITESQISDLTHYTDSDTLDYINSIGVVSGSVNWDTLIGKPSGIVSSSAQLSTEISGAFISTSSSLASNISTNDGRLTTLEGKTLVSSSAQITITESQISDLVHYTDSDTLDYINTLGVVSSSAQLSTEISGAFTSTSASLASDITTNSNRLTTIEGKTLVSSSAQITITESQISDLVHYTDSDTLSYINSLDVVSGSTTIPRTDSSNNFAGTQTFLNVIVNGTGSFAYVNQVTGSAKIIGDNYIFLNADSPTQRYSGLKVFDSGSADTGSLEYDSVNNHWFYESTTEGYASGFMAGPRASRGAITWPSNNYILKGTGGNHLGDSIIYESGSNIGIGKTDPAYKLDVAGNTRSDNVMIGADVTYGGTYRSLSFGYNGDGSNRIFATHDSADGMYFAAATGRGFTFRPNGGTANSVVINSAGNVGIGVTPSAWNLGKAFEINSAGNNIWSYSNDNIYLNQNSYYNSGFKYGTSGTAAQYILFQGQHLWYNAPSGTAGDPITFTQAMKLDASGRLGIGTSSPSTALEVAVDNSGIKVNNVNNAYMWIDRGAANRASSLIFQTNNVNNWSLGLIDSDVSGADGTEFYIGQFIDGSSPNLVIETNGNVGIGTTSPLHRLDVDGALRLRQTNNTPYSATLIELGNRNSEWSYGINFNQYYDGTWKYRETDYSAGIAFDVNGNLRFNTTPSGSADSAIAVSYLQNSKLFISNGGNVGIGTTSPSYKLHVTENSFIGTTVGPALTLGRVSGSPNIKADSGASGWFIADSNGGNAALNYFVTDNVILAQGGGNVGIGTTSPASKLQVNGTATVTSLVETSAKRFKENIHNIEDTSIIDKLRPVSFDWKDSKESDYGFIAEEVAELDKLLVTKSGGDEQLQGIKYTKLIPLLVKKIQEQEERISQLESKKDNN